MYKFEITRRVRLVCVERNLSLEGGENVPSISKEVREFGRTLKVCL